MICISKNKIKKYKIIQIIKYHETSIHLLRPISRCVAWPTGHAYRFPDVHVKSHPTRPWATAVKIQVISLHGCDVQRFFSGNFPSLLNSAWWLANWADYFPPWWKLSWNVCIIWSYNSCFLLKLIKHVNFETSWCSWFAYPPSLCFTCWKVLSYLLLSAKVIFAQCNCNLSIHLVPYFGNSTINLLLCTSMSAC